MPFEATFAQGSVLPRRAGAWAPPLRSQSNPTTSPLLPTPRQIYPPQDRSATPQHPKAMANFTPHRGMLPGRTKEAR